MIIAILFSLIGLGVVATTLQRMTVNALPLFVALSAAFAADHAGIGIFDSIIIAFAVGAAVFGLFDATAKSNVHTVVRLIARVIYIVPACTVAWFMTLAFARIGHVSELSATLMAMLAVPFVGTSAWQSRSPTD